MDVDSPCKGEGFRNYYIQKIEELQLIVNEKGQNLRRLQAQRNELNAKGISFYLIILSTKLIQQNLSHFSSHAPRGIAVAARTRKLRR